MESAGLNRRHAGLGNGYCFIKGRGSGRDFKVLCNLEENSNFIERIYSFCLSEDLDSGCWNSEAGDASHAALSLWVLRLHRAS